MRYIVNDENYVIAAGFGSTINYADCDCTEYTGAVPSGWSSLEEWYEEEGEKLWRWKIVNGNLTLDSSAVAPEEGHWGVPKLQSKYVTPGASAKIVKPDEDYDGLSMVSVIGDGDLVSENIKSGVTIFGVTGTLTANSAKIGSYENTNSYTTGSAVFAGLGRDDDVLPTNIFIIYTSGTEGSNTSILESVYIWIHSDGAIGMAHVDGTFGYDTSIKVTSSGGNITITPNYGLYAPGNYAAIAYWEE